MPQIQFAASHRHADLMLILALWHELTREWHLNTEDPMGTPMRRRHAMETLATYLCARAWPNITPKQAERACGFDIVLRLASGQLDTMHATDAFFICAGNGQWFTPVDIVVEGHNRTRKGVQLTQAATAFWSNAADVDRRRAIGDARRLLESDLESQGVVVRLLPVEQVASAPSSLLPVVANRRTYLETLVRNIHDEPFQPVYRKRLFGTPVKGWSARLQAYFWPAPEHGYRETCLNMQEIIEGSSQLASALATYGSWNETEQLRAVELAHIVFNWGGVPQDEETVTPYTVQQVYKAALNNDNAALANMNSGWTKVAAFATAHFEHNGDGHPQAIWDSRVATAIISRLDHILPGGENPTSLFPGVGTVPGRGGTRPRTLTRQWPLGYRTWLSQIAGSEVVRDMRDILNGGSYPSMPLPNGGTGKWTTRGVEMVLFMDGY